MSGGCERRRLEPKKQRLSSVLLKVECRKETARDPEECPHQGVATILLTFHQAMPYPIEDQRGRLASHRFQDLDLHIAFIISDFFKMFRVEKIS